MTDIVERLRENSKLEWDYTMDLQEEAAAEIERLRGTVMELCVKSGRMQDENEELHGIIQQAADDVVAASYPRAMHLEWLEAARKVLAEDD
jgi:hypothetical protein